MHRVAMWDCFIKCEGDETILRESLLSIRRFVNFCKPYSFHVLSSQSRSGTKKDEKTLFWGNAFFDPLTTNC